MSLTKQEMFDRAYRGLASQGWVKAIENGRCVYLTSDGCRCAWGWVDPDGTRHHAGSVGYLARKGIGMAPSLDSEMLQFASELQGAHDNGRDDILKLQMERFARDHNLTIPELP